MINPCGLHMIVGPTGSGKSAYMMRHLARILATSERTICTNLPIEFPGLIQFLLDAYGQVWTIERLKTRIYQPTDFQEIQRFWLSRGFGWFVIDVSDSDYEVGLRPDYSVVYRWIPKVVNGVE